MSNPFPSTVVYHIIVKFKLTSIDIVKTSSKTEQIENIKLDEYKNNTKTTKINRKKQKKNNICIKIRFKYV